MQKTKYFKFIFFIIISIAAFNVFINLNGVKLDSWDESRHGVSAIEMIESGNYVVNTYNLEPDYFNAKPVLSFMPMVAGFKLFGFTPFGLRFFSAISFLLTLLALAFFSAKTEGFKFAILSTAIFASSIRLVTRHGARTGDADAFFVLLYALAIMLILLQNKKYYQFYLASCIAGLAFLTKSFHAGPLCLTIVIIYLWDNKINKQSILHGLGCVFAALLPVAIWAVARYQYDGIYFFERMFFMTLCTGVYKS